MKNFICLALLTVAVVHIAFAQKDSTQFKPRFAIYTDLILDALSEKNIEGEIKISPRFALGAAYGRVIPSVYLGDHMFIPSHDEFPGRIYDGYGLKAFTKFYLKKRENYYIQAAFQYKQLQYDSADFFDGGNGRGIYFSRANEKAWLLGADILLGMELLPLKYVYFDGYAGLGYRFRSRNYTTYKHAYGSYNSNNPPPPLGDFLVHQDYIALIIGIKMGFCLTKK